MKLYLIIYIYIHTHIYITHFHITISFVECSKHFTYFACIITFSSANNIVRQVVLFLFLKERLRFGDVICPGSHK